MSLRILGGSLKGRLLKAPKGTSTRPTLGVVRKAVFDICQSDIEGAFVLDVFAGSGAVGIEALSAGAAHVTFIENHPLAIRAICDNITTLKIEKETHLIRQSVFLGLQTLFKQKKSFDIVYIDPPYTADTKLLQKILLFFEEHPIVKKGGVLFLEEKAPATITKETGPFEHLELVNTRQFSQSILHQFRYL